MVAVLSILDICGGPGWASFYHFVLENTSTHSNNINLANLCNVNRNCTSVFTNKSSQQNKKAWSQFYHEKIFLIENACLTFIFYQKYFLWQNRLQVFFYFHVTKLKTFVYCKTNPYPISVKGGLSLPRL